MCRTAPLDSSTRPAVPAIGGASPRWAQAFSDGYQIGLVAVFRPKDSSRRSWTPDGQPMQGIPEWNNTDVEGKALAYSVFLAVCSAMALSAGRR